jgi:hypothetical protein
MVRGRVRRRRIRRTPGPLPPKAANRLALSLAIKASSPARTTAVFSAIPLSRAASLNNVSSIFRVVLICISMHDLCITSQAFGFDAHSFAKTANEWGTRRACHLHVICLCVSSRPRADRGPRQAPHLRLLGWFSPRGGTCCPSRWQGLLAALHGLTPVSGQHVPPAEDAGGKNADAPVGMTHLWRVVAKFRVSNRARPGVPGRLSLGGAI